MFQRNLKNQVLEWHQFDKVFLNFLNKKRFYTENRLKIKFYMHFLSEGHFFYICRVIKRSIVLDYFYSMNREKTRWW